MKRVRRFGLSWWRLNEEDHRWLAPRTFWAFLLLPILLWGLIRAWNWLLSN